MKPHNGSMPRRHARSHRIVTAMNDARLAPEHEVIAERAYAMWMAAGCEHGRDVEFWLEAERELRTNSEEAPRMEVEEDVEVEPLPT